MKNVTMNIPMQQLKDRVCKCGGFIFVSALALKEVPPIYSTSGQYETAMQQVGFMCIQCGNVLPIQPETEKVEEKKIICGDCKADEDQICGDGKEEVANKPKIVLVKN